MEPASLAARLEASFPAQPGLWYQPVRAATAPAAELQPTRERSRSPLAPLRPGAAGRHQRTRGSLPDLSTASARAAALAELHADVYAESSRSTLGFKWRTIVRMLSDWGFEALPPTLEKVYLSMGPP